MSRVDSLSGPPSCPVTPKFNLHLHRGLAGCFWGGFHHDSSVWDEGGGGEAIAALGLWCNHQAKQSRRGKHPARHVTCAGPTCTLQSALIHPGYYSSAHTNTHKDAGCWATAGSIKSRSIYYRTLNYERKHPKPHRRCVFARIAHGEKGAITSSRPGVVEICRCSLPLRGKPWWI